MLKYLEIDSTYRDRQKFPNPSQFELLISQTGSRDSVYTSVDPITYAAPRVTYCPVDINNVIMTSSMLIPSAISQTISSTTTSIVVIFPVSFNVSKITNYYRACGINITSGSTTYSGLIQTSEYLTTTGTHDYFRVSLNKEYTQTQSATKVTLTCPTKFSEGLIYVPTGEYASQIYDDWYVYNETLNEYSKIVHYDGLFCLASMYPVRSNWQDTHIISLRKQIPVTVGTFQSGSTSTSIIISSLTSDSRSGYYNGMFVRFTSGVNRNRILGIYSYVGAPVYKVNLIGYIASPPVIGETYEILPFTKDNYTPFSYSGSIISQESCYDVQLIYLIIPNVILASGGSIASYPYFYVELQNVSTAGGNSLNVSYSNNPNANKKLFRVPITDFSIQADDAFLTLDKSNSLQTVRINPFGNFKFGVYLPDGSPLTLFMNDTESPYPPNPYLQISAVFALRRVRA